MKLAIVTGSSGYIGQHLVTDLLSEDYRVLGLDINHSFFLENKPNFKEILVDLSQKGAAEKMAKDFSELRDDAVLFHLAAKKSVEESIRNSNLYTRNNFHATENVLNAMVRSGLSRIIFSSSAAVYGSQNSIANENCSLMPESPYAAVKIQEEEEIIKYGKDFGLNFFIFRFFNVAGAGTRSLVETSGTNVVPSILESISKHEPFKIFGSDYPTPDGTCIRDYIDVRDVVSALTLAGSQSIPFSRIYNLGTEKGSSVLQLVNTFKKYTELKIEFEGRREGDMACLLADCSKIYRDLGWSTVYSLDETVRSVL